MIEIIDIHKSFKTQKVLKGVNLIIETGKTTTIIGRSGSGKSVLLKLMISLLKPDRGSILFYNKDIVKMKGRELNEFRKRVGFLFQNSALFDSMNLFDNVAFPLIHNYNLSDGEIRDRVLHILETVGLVSAKDKMISELSGGMKKRAALARAIVTNPEILLFDEPTTGLDPVTSSSITELLFQIKERFKVTTVVITHDMNLTSKISDTVSMLYDGVIVHQGSPKDFIDSSNPIVRQFVEGSTVGPMKML